MKVQKSIPARCLRNGFELTSRYHCRGPKVTRRVSEASAPSFLADASGYDAVRNREVIPGTILREANPQWGLPIPDQPFNGQLRHDRLRIADRGRRRTGTGKRDLSRMGLQGVFSGTASLSTLCAVRRGPRSGRWPRVVVSKRVVELEFLALDDRMSCGQ